MHTYAIRNGIILVGLTVVLSLPWVVTSAYSLGVINVGLITAVVALGLNIAKGYCGLFSAGHAGFWAIGAYTAALLAVKLGWPFPLTMLSAVVVATAFGVLMGIPVLRLKGLYLAMATIGFGLMVQLTAMNWRSLTNGPDGISNIPFPELGPFTTSTPMQLYYLLLVFTALSAWFSWRVKLSKYGRAMLAIHSNEQAAQLMGVNTVTEKILALSISAGLAGLGGGLYAHAYGYVSPEQFGFNQSVMFIVMLVIGGLGTVSGAIGGALFLTFLPEWMRPLRHWSMTIYGAMVVIFIVLVPGGLVGLGKRFLPWVFATAEPLSKQEVQPTNDFNIGNSLPLIYDKQLNPNGVVLEVQGLSISFGGLKALQNVDITLHAGQIHALIGPNGAGKTTLVNCITGVYAPDSGTIKLAGEKINGVQPYLVTRLGIARTFQNLALWKELSVLDNLLISRRGWQRTGFWQTIFNSRRSAEEEKEIRYRAEILLRAIGLWEYYSQPVGSLPYGHQKLVEIARALMTGPKVLLLDEPAAGLTRPEVNRLMALIREIRDMGVAVLIIDHNMELVMDIAQYITVLNFGRHIASDVPAVICQQKEVVEAYLGAESLVNIKLKGVEVNA